LWTSSSAAWRTTTAWLLLILGLLRVVPILGLRLVLRATWRRRGRWKVVLAGSHFVRLWLPLLSRQLSRLLSRGSTVCMMCR
jgi:hypothetical protein